MAGGRRKFIYHGSRRATSETKTYVAGDAGAQSFSINNIDLFKIVTVASCCGVLLALCVSDIYEGQRILIDWDSNDACDTITVTLNGTASSVDVATSPTANQRNLLELVILDDADAAEKGSLSSLNANIT